MPQIPQTSYNGRIQRNPRERVPPDIDHTPFPYRRYINNGAMQVQLWGSLRNQIARGVRFPYRGAGWLYGVRAIIPGLQRDQVGGFPPGYGMDPTSVQKLMQFGPGAQPTAPGFPGMLTGPVDNPMSG